MNRAKMYMSDLLLWIEIQYSFFIHEKKLCEDNIDSKLWRRKFLNLRKIRDLRCKELLHEFLECKLQKITHHKMVTKNRYAPFLFCVIKNDISKISKFMDHYRKLGVERFVFLDNGSNDGTREFLCEQKDTIVYYTPQKYSSVRRVAWLNRLLAIYGNERWCLVVDSDELLNFIGSEKYFITDVVKKAIEINCDRVEGFLLDMYSDKEILQESNNANYIEKMKFFDKNSYTLRRVNGSVEVTGGPRKRIFHTDVLLSKYPLFFCGEAVFVSSSHYVLSSRPIKKCPMWFVICHYKFIDEKDLDKIKEAVRNENYARGSYEYKKYLLKIENDSEVSFYQKGNSVEMTNTDSFKEITFLNNPFS